MIAFLAGLLACSARLLSPLALFRNISGHWKLAFFGQHKQAKWWECMYAGQVRATHRIVCGWWYRIRSYCLWRHQSPLIFSKKLQAATLFTPCFEYPRARGDGWNNRFGRERKEKEEAEAFAAPHPPAPPFWQGGPLGLTHTGTAKAVPLVRGTFPLIPLIVIYYTIISMTSYVPMLQWSAYRILQIGRDDIGSNPIRCSYFLPFNSLIIF